MLAGHFIHRRLPVRKKLVWLSAILWVLCIAIPVVLSRLEYDVTGGDIAYSFLDWRIKPSTFMLLSAMCAMYMVKALYGTLKRNPFQGVIRELSACTLFIYLTHHIAQSLTQNTVYLPLADRLTAMPAVVIWELLIMFLCTAVAIPLRRLPLLRHIL